MVDHFFLSFLSLIPVAYPSWLSSFFFLLLLPSSALLKFSSDHHPRCPCYFFFGLRYHLIDFHAQKKTIEIRIDTNQNS